MHYFNPDHQIKNPRAKRVHLPRPEAYCDDWAFVVPLPAFYSALDIAWSVWRIPQKDPDTGAFLFKEDGKTKLYDVYELTTQGPRPAWAFSVGDTLHSSPALACAKWGAGSEGYSLQVAKIDGDVLTVRKYEWPGGAVDLLELTQARFVELLRYGFGEDRDL